MKRNFGKIMGKLQQARDMHYSSTTGAYYIKSNMKAYDFPDHYIPIEDIQK